jgi:pumilio homology domain family member 6
VLMQLLAPHSQRYLPPSTLELLHPPSKTMMVPAAAAGGNAAARLDQEDEEMDNPEDDAGSDKQDAAGGDRGGGEEELVQRQLGESKKEPDVRRRELLGTSKDGLAAALCALCATNAPQLLRGPVGAVVMVEVVCGAAGGLLWQLQQEAVEAVHVVVVQQVAADCSALSASSGSQQLQQAQLQGGKHSKKVSAAGAAVTQQQQDKQQQEQVTLTPNGPLLTDYHASRALRRMLLAGETDGISGDGARAFAARLWNDALRGHCAALVGGHAAKVVAALLHCGVPAVQTAAAAELKPVLDDVSAWAAGFMGPATAALSGSKAPTAAVKQGKKERRAGAL